MFKKFKKMIDCRQLRIIFGVNELERYTYYMLIFTYTYDL